MGREWIKININNYCRVVLTEAGANRLNEKNDEMSRKYPSIQRHKRYAAGDIYEAQMWCLIQEFDDMIGICRDMPFGTEMDVSKC